MNFLFRVRRYSAGLDFALVLLVCGTLLAQGDSIPSNPIPAACIPTPSGLVGWWRGQSNALDSWAGHDGVAVGSLGYESGKIGSAYSFSGKPAAVRVAGSAVLDVGSGDGFTLEAWVRPAGIAGAQPLFGWYSDSYWATHILIIGNNLYANLPDRNGNWRPVTGTGGTIVANTWQHVALTYQKSNGEIQLWLNGVVVAKKIIGSDAPDTRNDLYFGSQPNCGRTNSFTGGLDEISLYNRALAPAEVVSLFQAGADGKCPSTTSPRIVKQPETTAVKPGKAAKLTIRADGANQMGYQWKYGSLDIPEANSSTLTLPRTKPENAGRYSVMITNGFGAVTSAHVRVILIPKFPVIDQLIAKTQRLHTDPLTLRSALANLRTTKAAADLGKFSVALQLLESFKTQLPSLVRASESAQLPSLTATTDSAMATLRELTQ